MSIRPEHQEYLTKHGLFLLDQLPEQIQPIAIQNVIKAEHVGFLNNIKYARDAVKRDIHACINNRQFIRQLYSNRQKLKSQDYCRKFVLSNLCEFKADGSYYTYCS